MPELLVVAHEAVTAVKTLPVHPATYSVEIVPVLSRLLCRYAPEGGLLLDPMAGTGKKLAAIAGGRFVPYGVEIEQGYFVLGETAECVVHGDSTELTAVMRPIVGGRRFSAAVVSPSYPNGVSDNFNAQDSSARHTYVHRLRARLGNAEYELHPNNSGGANPRRSPKALKRFYEIHLAIWSQTYLMLEPGAPFVVNVKDTNAVTFLDDTWGQLEEVGFVIVHHERVATPGLNHGKNHERKVDGEEIIVAIKPPTSERQIRRSGKPSTSS